MKRATIILTTGILLSISSNAYSEINLKVTIDQMIGSKKVETIKSVSGNYEQDIEILSEGLKNKIVLNLRKFKNILVNGNKINPVQIDMKVVNELHKVIGKPQTVTSFYNKSAQFSSGDLNISVAVEEI